MKNILNHTILIGFCLIAVLLHVHQKLLPLSLVLVSLAILSYPDIKGRFKAFAFKKYMAASCILYGLHAIGLLYSTNLDYGTFDLEVKASFLLLPPILALTPEKVMTKLHLVLKTFLITGAAVVTYTLIFVSYEYATKDLYFTYYLYNSRMSQFIHVGYLAIYLNLSIALILLSFITNIRIGIKSISIKILFLLLYITLIVISGSKNGFIVAILLLFLTACYYTYQNRKYKRFIYFFSGLILLSFMIYVLSPKTIIRLKDAAQSANQEILDKSTTSSNQIRKIAWSASLSLIKEKPIIGHGSGDVKDQLMSYYKENGYTGAYEKKMNAHNQFMQTTIGLGLVGLSSLLSLFGLLIYYSLKNKDIVLAFFTLIFVLASLTESVFEVQAGVVFFNFMVMILLMRKRSAV